MIIAILSDIHLGVRYFRKTRSGVNAIESLVYEQFTNCIDDIVDNQPDLFVIAGDLFHKNNPSAIAIKAAENAFEKLDEARIQTIVIGGNHDYDVSLACTHPFEIMPKYQYIDFVYDYLEVKTFLVKDAAICCVPHFNPPIKENDIKIDRNALNHFWGSIISKAKSKEFSESKKILLSHGVIESVIQRFINSSNDASQIELTTTILPDAVIDSFDYSIIGHIHNAFIQEKEKGHIRISPGSIIPGTLYVEEVEGNVDSQGPMFLDTETGEIEFHDIETFKFCKRIANSKSEINDILSNVDFNVYNISFAGSWEDIDVALYNEAMRKSIHLNLQLIKDTENVAIDNISNFWDWVQANYPKVYPDFKNILKEE